MSEKIIFTLKGVSKVVPPKKQILKDIYLSFYLGAKIGVLGANGSGKSSLLKIIAGLDDEYDGEVLKSDGVSVGILLQEPPLDESKTVGENVALGMKDVGALLAEFQTINARFAEEMSPENMEKLIARQAEVQEKIDACNGWEMERQLEVASQALRLPPLDSKVTYLSGGERRRVALCRLLLEQPDVLLLDEPTNHLDAESVGWLELHLKNYAGTVIAVTHDRYFLDNVAGWILELDRGEGLPFKGNYTSWLKQKEERLEVEKREKDQRAKTMRRELEWINSSPSARRAKSKARISAYEKMLAEGETEEIENLQIYIPPGPRLGNNVVEFAHVGKAFGDRLLIEDLTFSLPRGGIVGVIGPNGAGKTTLFKMIVGSEKPDSGEVKVGETVKIAYAEQTRDSLQADHSIFDEISQGDEIIKLGKREINARAYVSRWMFSGDEQQKKVGILSGGERNRVLLAKMLREGSNLLLLDEPSNDLDVHTLRALEEALNHYAGCAVVISHDRWFLDRVATAILAFEGDSKVVYFEGNYSDYEEDRLKRLGKDALPKPIRYKPLKVA
ncbi:MAG: energy-dependent translational throttle protein EttA [Deltaproteobacteria bacterium CG11_big_fil_rev_8_21_14_0_20_45_16]|nr:MAG: energy-dependent translational throttle protein EttA [Deltaproteobacteria bacterium CG11_big_fil_rev_8_21_14_0_20_45_16]